MSPLNRQWMMSRIPHQGSMCLLEEVVEWTADNIRCRTRTHRSLDNPLRCEGRLGIACGIEYAAQAMAIHGALSSDTAQAAQAALGSPKAAPRASSAGFLAAVRNVQFRAARLDDVQHDLLCDVSRVAGGKGSALYDFELRGGERTLLSGRATVILDTGSLFARL